MYPVSETFRSERIEPTVAYYAGRTRLPEVAMYLRYVCRHCGEELGRFDLTQVDESRLGLDVLTSEERSEMMYADPDGSQTTVQIVCDDCARPVTEGHLVH